MLTVHTFFNTILNKNMLTVHTFFNTILIKKMLTVHTFKKTALTGSEDCTKCFTCTGMLCDWLQTDDLLRKHAVGFPFCIYVRFMKGDAFIRECHNKNIMEKIMSSIK